MKSPAPTPDRLSSEKREKALRLALHRIERGRSHTGAKAVSISAVAREAGVTPALIHNHYPAVAEAIRAAQGKATRVERDKKHDQLKKLRARIRDLDRELEEVREQRRRLVSINENLLQELEVLRVAAANSKVVPLSTRQRADGGPK